MKDNQPRVSVIIPTCNRPEFIKKAVLSVLNQTYHDFEIIIIDDGLNIRAEESVSSIGDDRIKYIKHEINKGGAAARNTGIKNAKGEYIAFLDDDDEWLPEKLTLQVDALDKYYDVGFCFSAVTQKRDFGQSSSIVHEGSINYYKKSLQTFKNILTSSLIVRKNVFNVVGAFDESFPSHQEADLIIRISEKFQGVGINKPLVIMTVFSAHNSIGKNLNNRIVGRKMILDKHFDAFIKYPKYLAKHYFQLALYYRDADEFSYAKDNFKKALAQSFSLRSLIHFISMFFNGFIYSFYKKYVEKI